ncbi:bifunctional riboflavin kinase/FAD synthetase [Lachnoclostridium sp. An181]|uniref:bifunctional riboflavin kinase/FAD synthetase n=1 Tax=Lachnoclostridium sp. An181 TaxID=1965575 RepID=UPI000B38BFEF|nr:bifunctional riboflavin kinase/FAD synthetase [Lachnoclostridium sp. An181]OUP51017.1 riboflavin biosynthesis protein RibF [Lachnoclostridium sp. An181]
MKYIRGIDSYEGTQSSAVTLGKFDGLHLGHQKLIEKIKNYGKWDDLLSVVVAFDMSMMRNRDGNIHRTLITNEERKVILDGQIDCLIDCPFTDDILHMEAETFIRDILVGKLKAARIVVGMDFHFGYRKRGDFYMLQKYAKTYGYEVEGVQKECKNGREISSTYIKEELSRGNMELVRELLGRPFALGGTVEPGAKLGRELDMRTMNIRPLPKKILPPNGVYAVNCYVDGKTYRGIANLGTKPTVKKEGSILLETHLFSFEKEMYGKEIEVKLLHFARPEQKFASVEELKKVMQADVAAAETYFNKTGNA